MSSTLCEVLQKLSSLCLLITMLVLKEAVLTFYYIFRVIFVIKASVSNHAQEKEAKYIILTTNKYIYYTTMAEK